MYKCLLIICFIIASVAAVKAQQIDSLGQKSKTDKKLQQKLDSAKANPIVPKIKPKEYHPDSNHIPHKAVMHSLEIPGWGQLYNHQYWKIPVIYAGLGLIVWAYNFNRVNYIQNLAIAKYREQGTQPAPGDKYYDLYQAYQPFATDAIDDAVTGYERNKEISLFGFFAAWGFQTVDAYINAKFQHIYSMDNDLSLKISPALMNQQAFATNFNGSFIPGLKLTFTLR